MNAGHLVVTKSEGKQVCVGVCLYVPPVTWSNIGWFIKKKKKKKKKKKPKKKKKNQKKKQQNYNNKSLVHTKFIYVVVVILFLSLLLINMVSLEFHSVRAMYWKWARNLHTLLGWNKLETW